ncbi:LacI family DNA-binding transcriptional regulator [Cryobacterium sp. PH31-O1]|nr:LacI family DNA-binding transcriptional regulator [Cryobacterium sp. PH31-O1]MDJ0338600.1 LacI family DNA-binding transcriptional regulator [Cryobacterium sp. PH31-O1]
MRQVAALAGLGIKTVSRVINGEPNVSPAMIAKVKQAADSLDYQPDRRIVYLGTRTSSPSVRSRRCVPAHCRTAWPWSGSMIFPSPTCSPPVSPSSLKTCSESPRR